MHTVPHNATPFEKETKGAQATVTSAVFVGVSFVFIVLRLFTRGVLIRNVGPEDWTILAAWITSLCLAIAILYEVKEGSGHHIQVLTPTDIVRSTRALYFAILLYQGALLLIKTSILLQYWRIFPARRVRLTIIVVSVIIGLYGVWTIFGMMFQCSPIPYFWDKTIVGGSCIDLSTAWIVSSVMNTATDLMLFLFPIPVLMRLRLPTRQKVGLSIVFALGGFVCLVAMLRLHALLQLLHSTDPTWENGSVSYWSSVEPSIAIICATLPTLKPFAQRFFPRLMGNVPADQHDAPMRPRKKLSASGLHTLVPTITGTEITDFATYDRTAVGTQRTMTDCGDPEKGPGMPKLRIFSVFDDAVLAGELAKYEASMGTLNDVGTGSWEQECPLTRPAKTI